MTPIILYDFEDGNGLVPAHKHARGGGWVADTAKVDATVLVSLLARVFGRAQVYDNVQLRNTSKVSDDVLLFGNARLCGDVHLSGGTQMGGDALLYGKCIIFAESRISTTVAGKERSCRSK